MFIIENEKDLLATINIFCCKFFIIYFCEKFFIDTVKNLKILSLKSHQFCCYRAYCKIVYS